jgi:hypothetical protein
MEEFEPGCWSTPETPEIERMGKTPPLGPIIIIHKPQYVNDV